MAQLEIDNLSVEFRTRHGVVQALEGVVKDEFGSHANLLIS